MRKCLILSTVVLAAFLIFGCSGLATVAPTPTAEVVSTPMPEKEYYSTMAGLGRLAVEALKDANNLTNVGGLVLVVGLEGQAAVLGKVHDAAVAITPPSKHTESHVLFTEGMGLYRDALYLGADAYRLQDPDKLEEASNLYQAAEEKMKKGSQKLQEERDRTIPEVGTRA